MISLKLTKIKLPQTTLNYLVFVAAVTLVILSLSNLATYFSYYSSPSQKRVLGYKDDDAIYLERLRNFAKDNPNYYPLLVVLAKAEYDAGNNDRFYDLLPLIKALNPNSEDTKNLVRLAPDNH